MTSAEPAIALRPARPADQPFFARVYASTRAEEIAPLPWPADQKRAFLAQQFEAQTAHYAQYEDASFDVVLADGEPAGRLIVQRREREISVVDIALLPEWRGRGIGSRLLRPILEEASARRVPVAIHVERQNPAMTLYRRLGFTPAGEAGIYLRMVRPPDGGQAKIAS